MDGRASNEIRDRLTSRSLTFSRLLCALAAAIPLLAAIGWIFGIQFLIKIHADLPPMQPNTAATLILSAIATVFTGNKRQSSRVVASAIGSVVSLLGLLILGEYIFSWDLGVDQIFIGDAGTAAG